MSKERIYTNLCIKCNKETVWSRVRDVTLKEHGINKPYKGVYQCKREVIHDNYEGNVT